MQINIWMNGDIIWLSDTEWAELADVLQDGDEIKILGVKKCTE